MIRSLLLCAALAPLNTAVAEEVAAVMLIQGTVTIHDGDGSYPADLGTGLRRSDTVVTGEESAVVLHLHNNHLVRLDEDLELEVADIVLLDAPDIPLDVDSALSSLLYPGERDEMRGADEASRVAGWQSRLSAGHSVGTSEESARAMTRGAPPAAPDPEPANERQKLAEAMEFAAEPEEELEEKEASDDDAGFGSSGAESFYDFESDDIEGDLVAPGGDRLEVRSTPAPPPQDSAPQPIVAESKSRGGGGKKKKNKEKKDKDTSRRGARPSGGAAPQSASNDDLSTLLPPPPATLEQELSTDTPLRQCLVAWADSLPVKIEGVQLSLRLGEDGSVARLRMDQGLTAPACARNLLVGRTPDASESQLVFDIRLSE